MTAPYFPKPIHTEAPRWKLFLARVLGNKIAEKRVHGMTIYQWRGVFYVTSMRKDLQP